MIIKGPASFSLSAPSAGSTLAEFDEQHYWPEPDVLCTITPRAPKKNQPMFLTGAIRFTRESAPGPPNTSKAFYEQLKLWGLTGDADSTNQSRQVGRHRTYLVQWVQGGIKAAWTPPIAEFQPDPGAAAGHEKLAVSHIVKRLILNGCRTQPRECVEDLTTPRPTPNPTRGHSD